MFLFRGAHRTFRALAACVAAFSALTSLGAEIEAGRPVITNFLPRDYKRHGQVWSAAQTADGLLYFGNRGAVLEFDGRTWNIIEVPSLFVQRVALGPDGHLYVSGTDLIGRLEKIPVAASSSNHCSTSFRRRPSRSAR